MEFYIFVIATIALVLFAIEANSDIKKFIVNSKMTAEEKEGQWPDPFHPEMRMWSVFCGVVEEGKIGLLISVISTIGLAMMGKEVPSRDIFLLFLIFLLLGARIGIKRGTFLPFQWRKITLPGVNIPAEIDMKQQEYFSEIFWPKFWPVYRKWAQRVCAPKE